MRSYNSFLDKTHNDQNYHVSYDTITYHGTNEKGKVGGKTFNNQHEELELADDYVTEEEENNWYKNKKYRHKIRDQEQPFFCNQPGMWNFFFLTLSVAQGWPIRQTFRALKIL